MRFYKNPARLLYYYLLNILKHIVASLLNNCLVSDDHFVNESSLLNLSRHVNKWLEYGSILAYILHQFIMEGI